MKTRYNLLTTEKTILILLLLQIYDHQNHLIKHLSLSDARSFQYKPKASILSYMFSLHLFVSNKVFLKAFFSLDPFLILCATRQVDKYIDTLVYLKVDSKWNLMVLLKCL